MTAVWDGELYAANTAHHRRFDDHVLAGLAPPPDGTVLDLGCGAGDLTRRLVGLVPRGRVLGVDADPSMVRVAAAAGGGPEYAVARAQDLRGAVPDASVDLVVSTAALHWVPADEQALVLAEVARVLRPGGTFRAELGGAGQIAAARAVLDEVSREHGGGAGPWCFPSPQEYAPLLAAAGLGTDGGWLRLVHQRRSMPDADALVGWLRSQVLIAYEPALEPASRASFRAEAERRALAALRRDDGTYDQDYVRLDLLARRAGEQEALRSRG
ncbi:class I SAM-dependent methyltransferase [Vallicoccus soli]|uniref:Class I SAM-dependent methyltransferase n=1 Tax=Vallicoccus soli TaxID=2339232 RepID=A0A3A3Z5I9_9ACTN|nr:class I SAM-dependent methyltransferase [Vallicoccus soli]RJK98233.1 class I SAM-dependent methyltransferase [Vallicoccus soli]